MENQQIVPVRGPDFHTGSRVPESLGWRRQPECDEPGRQAWAMPNGAILLLDPSGHEDSLLRQN